MAIYTGKKIWQKVHGNQKRKTWVKHTVYTALFCVLIIGLVATVLFRSKLNYQLTDYSVPGENYLICNEQSQYLTSPWTYSALPSGSQSYTVAQYEALAGYGTTLPPLPSYISSQSSSTEAAMIFAPGATSEIPNYDLPGTPIVYYFEGGAYGQLGLDSISGDEFIGGSAAGYPEPTFNDGGNAGGIDSGNAAFDYSGGGSTLASTATTGSSTLTTTTAIPGYIGYVSFADGTTYQISSHSGTSISLQSTLTSTENAGTGVYADRVVPIADLSAGASQGGTSLTLGASSEPIVPWSYVVVGDDIAQVAAVSGSESGYTLTLRGPLDFTYGANTPVFPDGGPMGDVTVKYLTISDDLHGTTATIDSGSGWVVEDNNLINGYSTPGLGIAVDGGDEGTFEYNCFSKYGDYAFNVSGTNIVVDYNEIYQTSYEVDPGCGCSGAGKWWGTLNSDIEDNAFVDDGPGGNPVVWFDNGNSGATVSGNYFYMDASTAVDNETGFNMVVTDNLFLDDGWGSGTGYSSNGGGAVSLNSSGGIEVPGSNHENQISIADNYFINDWEGVNLWQSAGQRNCMTSGEGNKDATTNSAYCSGGFPNTSTFAANDSGTINYDFSHYQYVSNVGTEYLPTVVTGCASSCSQITVSAPMAMHDQIGFSDPALVTDTADSMAVSSCTNSSQCTLTVSSTSGFPASGELLADTTKADAPGGGFTGAILSYSSTTSTTFTGVQLVTCGSSTPGAACGGSGNLLGGSGSELQAIEPYEVTAETCYATTCKVTVSPSIPSVSANSYVDQNGTCRIFLTSSASPTAPIAPNGVSYFDGCQWLVKNVAVTGNTFFFQPSQIAASAPLIGGGTTTACTATNNDGCGENFMATQTGCAGGSICAPYSDQTMANSMVSNSSLTTCPVWDPGCSGDILNNLNALSNSPGATADNDEPPANNLWSDNSYFGPWAFNDAYAFGNCAGGGFYMPSDSTTSKSLPASACGPISITQWQSDWQQDTSSTYNPLAVSLSGLSANQEIHGPAQSVLAYEDSGTAGTITSKLTVNGTTVSTLTSSPSSFSLNTLTYSDGPYTVGVTGTDSGSNTNSDSESVYVANGDFNGDGKINLSDLAILAAHWSETDSTYTDGNITGQSTINLSDLAVLAANWGWVE